MKSPRFDFAQSAKCCLNYYYILILELDGDVIIDIDDLEMVLAHPEYFWLCLYVVPENNVKICHYSAWKTKQEALIFAMQMPGCGKHHVINRFTLKIV